MYCMLSWTHKRYEYIQGRQQHRVNSLGKFGNTTLVAKMFPLLRDLFFSFLSRSITFSLPFLATSHVTSGINKSNKQTNISSLYHNDWGRRSALKYENVFIKTVNFTFDLCKSNEANCKVNTMIVLLSMAQSIKVSIIKLNT